MKQKPFTAGCEIPASGIYKVKHGSHDLPNEVILHKGQQFPGCAKCDDLVLFELIHAAPDAFSDPDFCAAFLELRQLPALRQ